MDSDDCVELAAEAQVLRERVAELSEQVADFRARRLHQDAVIARLREQLRAARAGIATEP